MIRRPDDLLESTKSSSGYLPYRLGSFLIEPPAFASPQGTASKQYNRLVGMVPLFSQILLRDQLFLLCRATSPVGAHTGPQTASDLSSSLRSPFLSDQM
jgi:hypothetical protein